MRLFRRIVLGLLGLAGLLLLWQLAGRAGWFDTRFVPVPTQVVSEIAGLFRIAEFRADFVATVLAWLIALVVATLVAVPVGLLLGSVPGLRAATSVIIEFLRPVPTVTLIPIVLIAFGDGAQIKIVLAAFASIWPILFNVMYGLREIDPLLIDTARAYRTGRLRVALAVRLPSVAPFALTGIRLSAAISLIVIVSTEFINNSGIGFGSYVVLNGEQTGDMPMVVAGAILAGLLGALVSGLLAAVRRLWLGWSDGGA